MCHNFSESSNTTMSRHCTCREVQRNKTRGMHALGNMHVNHYLEYFYQIPRPFNLKVTAFGLYQIKILKNYSEKLIGQNLIN